MKHFFARCIALLITAITASGYTNTLENGTNQFVDSAWDISGLDLTVGDLTSNNFMAVINNGYVTNANGYIGKNVSASNNSVLVFSADAEWINTGDLYVGQEGSNNGLTVTNYGRVSSSDLVVGSQGSGNYLSIIDGSVVSNLNGYVGELAGASNNAAYVWGSDSEWVNQGTLQVGAAGNSNNNVYVYSGGKVTASNLVIEADNDFFINDGGTLAMTGDFDLSAQTNLNWNGYGTLSVAGDFSGTNDLDGTNLYLTIDGGTWTNNAVDRIVGKEGYGNKLSIINSGRVDNVNGYVGSGTNANGNTVLVSGGGSTWNNSGELGVGIEGGGNFLSIQSGGGVTNQNGYVGQFSGASNNTALVTGDGSHWINKNGLTIGSAETNSGNSVTVESGGMVSASNLVVHAGNDFNLNAGGTLAMTHGFNLAPQTNLNWNAGGTLSVGGALTGLTTTNEGAYLAGAKKLVLNEGSYSTATNLIVGYESSNNTLAITNSAGVANADGYIGWGSTAGNNSVLVSDDGSAWTNSGNLYVGVYGDSTNLMTAGSGNALTVSNKAWVYVGGVDTNLMNLGSGGVTVASNANMVVGNGASVLTEGLYIDDAGDFDLDGSLTVNGAFDANQDGFNWNNDADLTVKGALAFTNALDGIGKMLTLDGGSWDRGVNDLIVGKTGSVNKLVISNGGSANSGNGYIGFLANSASNEVTVSGDGSTWDNGANLYVGYAGSKNTLMVEDGARVDNEDGYIGYAATAMNNSATVTGSNSVWANSGNLYVGFNGSTNNLTISDGGFVENAEGIIGASSGSDKNTVTVQDAGSVWDNNESLVVGDAGSFNELIIQSGGGVTNAAGFVGRASGTSNNTATVEGAGSHWINNGLLTVGNDASNTANSVTVEDGGLVRASGLNIDVDDIFNLNEDGSLEITGGFDAAMDGFNWNRDGRLSVGGLLEGMAVSTNLPIDDAGYLNNGKDLTVGTWLNGDSNLIVGLNADGSDLVITNGGIVDNADGYIGWGTGSDNNSVLVKDGASWTNHGGGLYVGKWRNANTNLVNAGKNNSLTVETNGWVFIGETGVAGSATNGTGGLVVASTNGAELIVGGNQSAVTVEQTLYVGLDTNAAGLVVVEKGGKVSAGDLLIAEGSTFELDGTLEVLSGFNVAQGDRFIWNDTDSSLFVGGGALKGLDSFGGTNRTLGIMDGGTWDTTAADLYITGVGNTLSITNGGDVYSASAFLGNSTNDSGNMVAVEGLDSTWNISSNLGIGGAGSSNNTLSVSDQGLVDVGKDLFVHSGNTLEFASTGLVSVAGNMVVSNATVSGSGLVEFTGNSKHQLSIHGSNSVVSTDVSFKGGVGEDAVAITDFKLVVSDTFTNRFVGFENLNLTNSLLSGSSTLDGFPNISMSGGWIAPEGTLTVDGAFVATDTILRIDNSTDRLHVTSDLDISSMGAEVTIADDLNPVGFNQVILTADGGKSGEFDESKSSITEHYLLYDFDFDYSSNDVAVVSDQELDGEISSSLAYAGVQGIRAGFNGMQNSVFVRTKQLRRNSVATDHAIPHDAYLMTAPDGPMGAYGPGDNNLIFGMHFWAQQFSGQGNYDAMGKSSAFTLNNYGTTFGLDRLFGESLVAGINYTYARSSASIDDGSRVRTETYWLGLYGEWVSKEDYYLEGLAGGGLSDYDTERREIGYKGKAHFDGYELGGHVEAGKYLHRDNWALVPYVGLHYLWIDADSYTEESENPIEVDGQTVSSLESALGVKLRNRLDTRKGRFQTTAYAEWAYDFINDDIDSTLSDGTSKVKTDKLTPGESLLNTGIGVSWICTDYLEFGVGYDGSFNDNYDEHTGSIMMDVMF